MDLTNTTDGITDLPTSRDNWKTSAAERRPKGPLDSKVTLKNKSLIRNNCGNNREDRDTIDTSRSSSRSQISTLASAKTWFVDGSFKLVKAPFYQLWSVHAFVCRGGKVEQVPLLFVLTSGKRHSDCRHVLQVILDLLP